MYLFVSNSVNPQFNLATEEYLLKNSSENIIFLYRNQSCIIVGKHQNAMGEVNYRYVIENNIPVVRRISGGGTVYHDEGNLNFTFLQNGEEGNLVNFKSFITPVAEFLKSCGIPAEIGPRNDILIHGLKVSGNAEHIFRKRTLHHGTLLFSSALENLRNGLHVEPGKYTDRAVKSVRSKVTNIKESIAAEIDVHKFLKDLAGYLSRFYKAELLNLSHEAIAEIIRSAETKYADWSWNFGYSPAYTFKNSFNSGILYLDIEFEVEKGIIKQSHISGNLDQKIIWELNQSLADQPHSYAALSVNRTIAGLQTFNNIENKNLFWSFF